MHGESIGESGSAQPAESAGGTRGAGASTGSTGLGGSASMPGPGPHAAGATHPASSTPVSSIPAQMEDTAAARRSRFASGEDGSASRISHDEWETEPLRHRLAHREEPGLVPGVLLDHPLAALGLGVAGGLVLGLGDDRRAWARLKHGLKRAAAIAGTAGAAVLLERLLGSRPQVLGRAESAPGQARPAPAAVREPQPAAPLPPHPVVEPAGEDDLAWLISAEAAPTFAGLPSPIAEERLAALWERLALESLPSAVLCRAGDRMARLAYSHPQVLAPDVLRLFNVWPVLASADATVGAQVAWTAARGGLQRIVRALEAALRETGMLRTVAEAFVQASMEYAGASEPPLSGGVPTPPSTVYPYWPRDVRRVGPLSPAGPARRDASGPVHLGAAAPQTVRPRNRFLAFFAAYTEPYAAQVRERLMQEVAPEAVRLDKKRAAWKEGTRIVVVPVSEALEFDPPRAEFSWDGRFAIEDFTCTVRDDALLGSTVLEFQVFARVGEEQSVQFEKVRVGLGIVEDAPVYAPRLVTRRMVQTVFASYASEDQDLVSYKLTALPSLGIDVYEWRLNAIEGEVLKERIESEIRGRDVFFLFWSHHARASEWVRWELQVALDAETSGRPSIIPQLLENLEDEKDFPPELLGRQFFNPFFFLDRPEHIRARITRIQENDVARAPLRPAYTNIPAPERAPTADTPSDD